MSLNFLPFNDPYWRTKITSPIKLHGGKSYLCRRLYSCFNCDYDSLIDVCGGSAVMTLNAPRGVARVYNDLDPAKVNVMRMVKERCADLTSLLKEYTYSKGGFESAAVQLKCASSPLELAAAYIVRNRMSRGGLGITFSESSRLRGGQNENVNAWESMIRDLQETSYRLVGVEIRNNYALTLLTDTVFRWGKDSAKTLYYLDPPYLASERTTGHEYGDFEMKIVDHEELLTICNGESSDSHIAISGYRNWLYDRELAHWRRVDFEMPNHSGQGKTKERRVESLWMNF